MARCSSCTGIARLSGVTILPWLHQLVSRPAKTPKLAADSWTARWMTVPSMSSRATR